MRQDNVQRKVHGASWFFLSLICVYLCVVMILWKTNIGSHITMVQNLILSQSMIFVPTIIYILISKCDLRETLRLKKTHWLAIIIVPAFVVALEPLMTLINAISLLWVESATTELATGLVSNHKLWVSTLLMAVTPGIVEELAYRGVIMGSYRYGSRLAAIIIGGIMFGAMHMNFNQMAYAMVLGMMLGFLAEATGSIFTTMYAHFCFNEISVIISYIASHVSVLKQMVEKQASEGIAADQLKQTILIYIPFAFMGLCAAAAMIVLLAYLNGMHMDMLAMFRRNRNAEVKRPRIISVPLVLALCVCIGFMIITEFVL